MWEKKGSVVMMDLPKWGKWMARDEDGGLWGCNTEPVKKGAYWINTGSGVRNDTIRETDDTFEHVKWSDKHPIPVKTISDENYPTEFSRLNNELTKEVSLGSDYSKGIEYGTVSYKVGKHKELTRHLNETYRAKNKDYGDAFGKSHKKYGSIAGLTRISDKFNRLEEIILSKEQHVEDETVLDTLLDLANYSLMLYMELEREEE